MSWLKTSGMVLGAVLMLMSLAHGLLGWPMLRTELESAGVRQNSEAWNDAAAGWVFGSMSMFVFGVVIVSMVRSRSNGPTKLLPVSAIGAGLLAFGIGGCALIHVGAHFLAFAVLGVLILLWTYFASKWPCR